MYFIARLLFGLTLFSLKVEVSTFLVGSVYSHLHNSGRAGIYSRTDDTHQVTHQVEASPVGGTGSASVGQ